MFNMPLHVHTLSIFSISTPCTNAYSAQIWIFHVLKLLINLKVDITRSEKYFSFWIVPLCLYVSKPIPWCYFLCWRC